MPDSLFGMFVKCCKKLFCFQGEHTSLILFGTILHQHTYNAVKIFDMYFNHMVSVYYDDISCQHFCLGSYNITTMSKKLFLLGNLNCIASVLCNKW